jgi:hypothetical protein
MTSRPVKRPYAPPTASRVIAALLGTLPVALFAAAALARFLPAPEPVRFAIGYSAMLPLWLAAMCWIAVARSGRRAWLLCAAATVLTAALVLAIPH